MPKKSRATHVSAIPGIVSAPVIRHLSAKRIGRLRLNWFVIGSVFGVGLSFFMNFIVSAIILPQYDQMVARKNSDEVALAETKPMPKIQLAAIEPLVATDAFPADLDLELEVERGDTLMDMLIEHDVDTVDASNVIQALKEEFNPRQLRVGQKILLTLARHETVGDKKVVEELAIRLPNLSTVELERINDGRFSVEAIKAQLSTHAFRAEGTVKTSLSQAGDGAKIPAGAMAEIISAFSYDVDFQRDIQPGDTIEAMLDKKMTTEGEVGGYDNVRYAALTLQGKKKEIFKYDGNWYEANGNSVKKSLLRTPINAARISSGFGMRRHPILGYSKMHRGTDFAARTGTPIMAAGDGTIAYRGWMGGYGNYVKIRHNGTYSTAYGHMSRFGNIRQGSRVKQGQIIGYVGTTGRSTGPHLHYEVLQNGTQVNPVAAKFNTSPALTGQALAKFNERKRALTGELASLTGQLTVASR